MSRKETKEVTGHREHPGGYSQELLLYSAGGRMPAFAGLCGWQVTLKADVEAGAWRNMTKHRKI